jgi:hypothetical protein
MEQSEVSDGHRLTPAMSSRKLIALRFIKTYFARWGHSPTLGELAAELDVSRKRAYDLVHQLADEQMIEVVAGKARGIRLISRGEELSEADIVLRLVAMGWTVGHGEHVLIPPESAVASPGVLHLPIKALTTKGLHDLPYLDHRPGADGAWESEDGESEAGAGARAAAAARGATSRKPSRMGAASSRQGRGRAFIAQGSGRSS